MVAVLFDGELAVHYGFGFIHGREEEAPDLDESRAGQRNGLLGVAVAGGLSLMFGLHTGPEPLRIEWSEMAPAVDDSWEDVVEGSVEFGTSGLVLAAFEEFLDFDLPATGSHRVRFSGAGMDAARELDSRDESEPAPDQYLLQLWPAARAVDAVIKQTSDSAAYWHRVARDEPHPLSEVQEDLAGLAAAFVVATPSAQQEALIYILERVITVTGLTSEPAATVVTDRIRHGLQSVTFPELQALEVRLDEEAPPAPRTGQPDMHNMAWRQLQAGAALSAALTGTVSEVVQSNYGPLFHARHALDADWPVTRAHAIDVLDRP